MLKERGKMKTFKFKAEYSILLNKFESLHEFLLKNDYWYKKEMFNK